MGVVRKIASLGRESDTAGRKFFAGDRDFATVRKEIRALKRRGVMAGKDAVGINSETDVQVGSVSICLFGGASVPASRLVVASPHRN